MKKIDLSYRIVGLFKTYGEYIRSEMWREKSEVLREHVGHCERCGVEKAKWESIPCCVMEDGRIKKKCWARAKHQKCKHEKVLLTFRTSGEILQVHHKSYESLGQEKRKHLEVLCKRCHMLEHDKKEDVEI